MALCAALLEAASRGDAAHVTRLLRVKSCDVNIVDENGCSALQRAAADGHVDAVAALLSHSADPNKQDIVHGNTAAHEAAWKGYSRCVALLAAARADLHARNFAGFAPLHLACQNGHNQSCREILLSGAHPDIQNNYGDTSLHTSARYGHAGVTRILISAECSVSEQNKNGDTALHIAAAMGRRKLTRILLEAGCDKQLRNKQAETAMDIAKRKDLNEIIQILDSPPAKQKDKKKDKRDRSKERSIDVPDSKLKKKEDNPIKTTPKKKKTVTFEPAQKWSPYGCHYYPDPKSFPKPRLDSLPNEPLKKGEQYYLDLAGNICKGPIGVGYTCYCAPFFKHMEEKMNKDKQDLKQHIDKAHQKLDQKVTTLEMKTQGQISELTRCVAAERTLCRERHLHLEQWLSRGMVFRASERVKKLDYSPKGSLDIPPLKRTRSLEILDSNTREWNRVNNIIKSFNKNSESYDTESKEPNARNKCSRSTEILDERGSTSPSFRRKQILKGSRSTEMLDRSPTYSNRTSCRSPGINITNYTSSSMHENDEHDGNSYNVTAEIHVKSPNMSVSQSPVSGFSTRDNSDRYNTSSRQSHTKSPLHSGTHSDQRTDGSDCEVTMRSNHVPRGPSMQNDSSWKSQVLQRTADDMRKRVLLDKEISQAVTPNGLRKNCFANISQDGYIKIPKHGVMCGTEGTQINLCQAGNRQSVQEMIAKVEEKQQQEACSSPEPYPRTGLSPNEPTILTHPVEQKPCVPHYKGMEQPLRPAPILKDTSHKEKSKRFSLHNLIPFPTRKTFQSPSKKNGNNSESSDEDDKPIRSLNEPGPMRNTNLLKTLPLPNYDNMVCQPHRNLTIPQFINNPVHPNEPTRLVPKDAYFHEIPNRQRITPQPFYPVIVENGLPNSQYSVRSSPANIPTETHAPVHPTDRTQNINVGRNRNPLYHPTGIFDAMMQDHMVREIERLPHCYSGHLDPNTELEIANERDHGGFYGDRPSTGLPVYPPHTIIRNQMNEHSETRNKPQSQPDHNLLHSRLQSLAINTQLSEIQSQIDRESHNDSGYSTKVYGSSQGPSPSLSGNVECLDSVSGHRMAVANGKPPPGANCGSQIEIGASSLV